MTAGVLRRGFAALALNSILTTGSSHWRDHAKAALEGRRIRVTYGLPENPYVFQDEQDKWSGVLVDFFDEIQKEVGFEVEVVDVSDDSTSVVGTNRNDGCARDISRNRTDICIGNSWVNTNRLGYAKVLPTLWQERLELGVSLIPRRAFLETLLQAFRPFHFWLWLAIALVIFLYSVFAWYVECSENDRDFPDKGTLPSGVTSLYYGLFSFFWQDPTAYPVTTEGRILLIGFGFFTFLMLSSYTGSLTDVLLNTWDEPEYKTLQEALDGEARVCMWATVPTSYMDPRLKALSEYIISYEDGYRKLADGTCRVILLDQTFHLKAQERSSSEFCSMVLVGGPVVHLNSAWFVADWLAGPMSYVVADLIDRGLLYNLKRAWRPIEACNDNTVEGMKVENASGVFFLVAGLVIAAAVVHSIKRGVIYGRKSGTFDRLHSHFRRRCVSTASNGDKVRTSSSVRSTTSSIRTARGAFVSEPSMISTVKTIKSRLDPEDPAFPLVQAFRSEKNLSEMPKAKALLTIGEARSAANEELLARLQQCSRAPSHLNSPCRSPRTPRGNAGG